MRGLALLWGTVVHRPYVYAFFLCYLGFAIRRLGARGVATYTVLAFAVAFLSEYSSTRNGFPFGVYAYFDGTRNRELWLSNVPFWDSLSFVFLSYFSWEVAAEARAPRDSRGLWLPSTALLAGLFMMALDLVIDPLTLRGDRWFLGRIYEYPGGGSYFGVTVSNFAGWVFVGAAIVLLFQQAAKMLPGLRAPTVAERPAERTLAFLVYASVLVFNLAITAWIGEWRLLAAGVLVSGATLGAARVAASRRKPLSRRLELAES